MTAEIRDSRLTARHVGIALAMLIAAGVYPLAHAYLSITGVLTSPSGLDDFACLSCHAANSGHIVPPDRSCISCHPLDLERHLEAEAPLAYLGRIDAAFYALIASYSLFAVSFLLFVLKPVSLPRMAALLIFGLIMGGVMAAAFGAMAR